MLLKSQLLRYTVGEMLRWTAQQRRAGQKTNNTSMKIVLNSPGSPRSSLIDGFSEKVHSITGGLHGTQSWAADRADYRGPGCGTGLSQTSQSRLARTTDFFGPDACMALRHRRHSHRKSGRSAAHTLFLYLKQSEIRSRGKCYEQSRSISHGSSIYTRRQLST